MRACGSSRNVSLPETENFRSRIVPALNAARASGRSCFPWRSRRFPNRRLRRLRARNVRRGVFILRIFARERRLRRGIFVRHRRFFRARNFFVQKNLPARCARLALDNSAEEKSVPAPKIFVAGAFEKMRFRERKFPCGKFLARAAQREFPRRFFLRERRRRSALPIR